MAKTKIKTTRYVHGPHRRAFWQYWNAKARCITITRTASAQSADGCETKGGGGDIHLLVLRRFETPRRQGKKTRSRTQAENGTRMLELYYYRAVLRREGGEVSPRKTRDRVRGRGCEICMGMLIVSENPLRLRPPFTFTPGITPSIGLTAGLWYIRI